VEEKAFLSERARKGPAAWKERKEQAEMQGFSLEHIRQTVEEKVMGAVDGVLTRIPNGPQYREQFRQAIGGALNDLQQQAQGQAGPLGGIMGKLGGIFGHSHEQGNPPAH
jgi:hypothetical protein